MWQASQVIFIFFIKLPKMFGQSRPDEGAQGTMGKPNLPGQRA
jgi:hypothetical protein